MLRMKIKETSRANNPPWFLVYFKEDETAAVTPAKAVTLVETLGVGAKCYVKVKGKTYEGILMSYGEKEDVISVEDQFVNGIYTPDFLLGEDGSTGENDLNVINLLPSCNEEVSNLAEPSEEPVEGNASKVTTVTRKRKAPAKGTICSKSQPIKKVKKEKKTKPQVLKEQQSTITLVATSSSGSVPTKSQAASPDSISQLISKTPPIQPPGLISPPIRPPFSSSPAVQNFVATSQSSISTPSNALASNCSGSFEFDGNESPPKLPSPIKLVQSTASADSIQSIVKRLESLEEQNKMMTSQLNFLMKISGNKSERVKSTTALAELEPYEPVLHFGQKDEPVANSYVSLTPENESSINYRPTISPSPTSVLAPASTPPHHILSPNSTGTAVLPLLSPTTSSMQLLHPDMVIRKYPRLITMSTLPRLGVRLASEAYFGDSVLRVCTVAGQHGLPPLAHDKLMELKLKLRNLFPQFINKEEEFEPTWVKVCSAINHRASALRRNSK